MHTTTNRPNVIIFFTDQHRWDASSLYGNPLDLMPNFDRIAQEGTHFYNAFTCQPLCGPARSCLQTGLYATETGVYQNGIPLQDDAQTLATLFGKEGYRTGYIGKWHLGGVDPGFYGGQQPVPEERRGGYEYWLASDLPEFISDAYHTVLFDNENKKVFLPGYRADAYTDAAVRFLEDHKQEQFFLCVSYLEPHFQNHRDDFPAPDGYAEKYTGRWLPPDLASLGGNAYQQIGGYYGMIKRLDEAFGRIMDTLKSIELLENTIVLFVSDHGCHFKTRNDEYKRSCHESSIRIPVAARGPGFEHGGRIKALTSIIDIAPTLLEAAGIEVPETMSGRSAMPLIRHEDPAWPDDIYIQISESQIGRAVRTDRWKYCVSNNEMAKESTPYAGTYYEESLYDLESDPYELTNLIGMEGYEDITEVMGKRLLAHMRAAGEPEAEIIKAPVIPTEGHRNVHPPWER